MNLRKLPPSMLLTLGLACGDGKSSDETTTVNACLSPPDTTEVGTGSSSASEGTTFGPCLDIGPVTSTGELTGTGSSGADSTFGPCLSPEPPTGTSSSDTGTGTGTGTDSGTDTEGTTGMMGDELPPTALAPHAADSRRQALERLLERGTLPADVAARLRGRRSEL
jgi:hypothetical protein